MLSAVVFEFTDEQDRQVVKKSGFLAVSKPAWIQRSFLHMVRKVGQKRFIFN